MRSDPLARGAGTRESNCDCTVSLTSRKHSTLFRACLSCPCHCSCSCRLWRAPVESAPLVSPLFPFVLTAREASRLSSLSRENICISGSSATPLPITLSSTTPVPRTSSSNRTTFTGNSLSTDSFRCPFNPRSPGTDVGARTGNRFARSGRARPLP